MASTIAKAKENLVTAKPGLPLSKLDKGSGKKGLSTVDKPINVCKFAFRTGNQPGATLSTVDKVVNVRKFAFRTGNQPGLPLSKLDKGRGKKGLSTVDKPFNVREERARRLGINRVLDT